MRSGSIRLVAALATLVAALSCSSADSIPGPDGTARKSDSTLLAGLSVSGPVANAIIAADRSAAHQSAGVSAEVSYVSLVPGTLPEGTAATATNLRTAERLTVAIVDGGFDPQPIPASVGDTLQVTVSLAGGKPDVEAFTSVAAKVPPRIVRTRPPRGQTDVPLNMVITIVFTEPVDPASVNSTSVTLSAGASPVPGEVRVLPGTGYTVEFTPTALLAPTTTYTLTVGPTVTNLAGTSVGLASGVTFTTAPSLGSVTVSPDVATINAGQQLSLTATVRDAAGRIVIPDRNCCDVEWTSSAPDVATVHPASGSVVGIGIGTAVITARSITDGYTGKARIAVNPATTPVGAIVSTLCNEWGDSPCGMYAVNPDGSNGRFLTANDGFVDDMDPVWSPDGTSIAFRSQRGCDHTTTRICHNDLYVMKVEQTGIKADGSGLRSLTTDKGLDVGGLSWSPDGSRIVFAGAVIPTDLYLTYALYVMNADGSGLQRLVPSPPGGSASWPDWSADGSKIAYNAVVQGEPSEIHVVDADGSNDVRISTPSASDGDLRPKWSPDGKRIAFSRSWYNDPVRRGAPSEAFVMDADGSNVTQITQGGGWNPVWSPDGTKLALMAGGVPGLAIMNADGDGRRSIPLPNYDELYSPPSWRRAAAAAASVSALSRARP